MMDSEQRIAVIASARRWCGTPFHDEQRLEGVGVDCVNLIAAVYEEAGIVPHVDLPHYSPQFFLHERVERLISHVLRYAVEIAEASVGPGDLVLYKYGHAFAHAAIVVDWPRQIIHAHKLSGKVLATRPCDADLRGRATKFFSLG